MGPRPGDDVPAGDDAHREERQLRADHEDVAASLRELPPIDRWSCVKSLGAIVIGTAMVAPAGRLAAAAKLVVPISSETEVEIVESGGRSL